MSTRVQFRRGTTAQHTSFAGANAEVTIDTDKKALVVHDGTTPGGINQLDSANHIGFSTEAIASKRIPAPVDSFRTDGYASAGDGGGALWKRIADPGTVEPWHRQSADGAYWEIAEDVVTPQMFGGATRAALQDALNSPAPVTEIRDASQYLVDQTILVPTNKTLRQRWTGTLKATDGFSGVVVMIASGSNRVRLKGLIVDGNAAGGATGGNIQTQGGVEHTDLLVEDCYSFDSPSAGFVLNNVSNLKVRNNTATANASSGIQMLSSDDVSISGNYASDNGSAGISFGGTKISVVNNICRNNGQGASPADGITGYDPNNAHIVVSGNVLTENGNHGTHIGGDYLVISGNEAYGNVQSGIYIAKDEAATGAAVTVCGNTSVANGLYGIRVLAVNRASISGNTCYLNDNDNFSVVEVNRGSVSGNTADGSVSGDGFESLTCTEVAFSGNNARSNAGSGLQLNGSSNCSVNGGIYNSNGAWGIIEVGAVSLNVISDVKARNNTSGDISRASAVVRHVDTNSSSTVTAAASVALPTAHDLIQIDGTATVSGFTNGWPGRPVTIRGGSGTRTLAYGASLLLEGSADYALGQHDTVTLVCLNAAGTTWLETGRSVK